MFVQPLVLISLLATLTSGQQQYDYKQALNLSLLFFEAQRAGYLPLDNRVPWRGDSCILDRGVNGEDLTGGYFTQGTTATFVFPNAAATTVLAWSYLHYQDAYVDAGVQSRIRDAIQWSADHLIKCHSHNSQLYVMFGDPHHWGRPEDLMTSRTSYFINNTKPGSEVAAEAAAALAASALVLPRNRAIHYVRHAAELYEFAKSSRGNYHESVPEVANFYKSWSGYEDEIVWAAIWLFRVTTYRKYLNEAETFYDQFNLQDKTTTEFSWDNKILGLKMMLYKLTLKSKYVQEPKEFCDKLASGFQKTPKGLYYFGEEIGSLKYALNVAFLCLDLGELLTGINEESVNPYQQFALNQLNYVLGDTGRSYVVGFGQNYPKFPYHRGASCPLKPADCTWDAINSKSPNPIEILGAMVGGPNGNDEYTDSRDWKQNGVTVYQNSALQSLLAGVLSLVGQNKFNN